MQKKCFLEIFWGKAVFLIHWSKQISTKCTYIKYLPKYIDIPLWKWILQDLCKGFTSTYLKVIVFSERFFVTHSMKIETNLSWDMRYVISSFLQMLTIFFVAFAKKMFIIFSTSVYHSHKKRKVWIVKRRLDFASK